MNKFGSTVAKSISVVLQPFLMPFYSVALVLLYTSFYYTHGDQAWRILLPVFVFSFFLPSIFMIVLWKLGYVQSLALEDKRERFFPYLVFLSSSLSLTYFYYSVGLSFWFIGIVAAFPIIALVGFIVNFSTKISAHMLGIGGLVGGFMSVCLNIKQFNPFIIFIVLFLLAGCLGVSRLYLARNTPVQVYSGFLVGFVLSFISVLLGAYAIYFFF